MRKVVWRIFTIDQFEKEEKWLNEMADDGWALVSLGFGKYIFEECEKGEYTIRLEILEKHPSFADSRKYIEFMEGTGAEYVGNYLRWAYFRKKRAEGEFEIYSDLDSRIKHISRMEKIFLFVLLSGITLLIHLIRISCQLPAPVDPAPYIIFAAFSLFFVKIYINLRRIKSRLRKQREICEK